MFYHSNEHQTRLGAYKEIPGVRWVRLEAKRELEAVCSNEGEIELTIQLGVIERLWAQRPRQARAMMGQDSVTPQEPNAGGFRVWHGGWDIRCNELSCFPCLDR